MKNILHSRGKEVKLQRKEIPFMLIPDIFFRKSFDIAAIAGHFFSDCQLLLGCPTFSLTERLNAMLCSRGIPVRLRSSAEDTFIDDLLKISEKFSTEKIVFIPGEEKTVRFFLEYLQKYPTQQVFSSYLPDKDTFEKLCDKAKLSDFCRINGIPAPRSYPPESLPSLPETAYPLLLKPCSGGGSRGIFRLQSPEEVSEKIQNIIATEPYLIQELIPAENGVEGAFFLCRQGKTVRGYTHHRLLTNPPQGGVSVLAEYEENKLLLSAGSKFLEKAGWNGLAMVEYLFDPRDGIYKIIEVNPRIWGSVLLSEYSGAHLLVNYINFCLGREPITRNVEKPVYIRWFFPLDILNVLKKNRPVSWFRFDHTCFINWTYSKKWRAVWFNLQALFSLKNFKRFLRR